MGFRIVSMNLDSNPNPELEELIIMEAEVLRSENKIRLALYNNSDESFVTSGFHGNNNTPIRFFDGENWRIVPHNPNLTGTWQEDSVEYLYPHTRWRWTINLGDYYLPESGLFRYILGIAVGHTVYAEFVLP
jgi:hypothetical protein